ncbi:hypothetical protein [Bacillus sp. ISL-55]|uniref:hypothetical protein n=1 Tax=Bacillus sp. ISL-55 TaxID=2819134 RepID=UPI001BE7C6EB|nr:hypothetical protein [Bacillus sp. ISL-55]MBT2691728.1 hypothetical protein [Bacillus sp. ISL-55]
MRKVVCKNNEGLEMEFTVGDIYEVEREFDTTYIVTNKFGKKHSVFKTHFVPIAESESAI